MRNAILSCLAKNLIRVSFGSEEKIDRKSQPTNKTTQDNYFRCVKLVSSFEDHKQK